MEASISVLPPIDELAFIVLIREMPDLSTDILSTIVL